MNGTTRTKGTLVIGSLPRIVAAVARSLDARGIPVHGACAGPRGRRTRSNAFRSFTFLGGAEEDGNAVFESLKAALILHDIDTVIPCEDEILLALAPHDDALRKLVHYCAPSPEACRKVLQKHETLAIASAIGVPVPGEYNIPNSAALADMGDRIRFPVIVKPRNKEGETITEIKSQIVRTREELTAYFDKYPAFGSWFLIQEYIPGIGVAIELLMHQGDPLAAFQHRRNREYPVRGGVSVAAVSEPLEARMLQHAVALLRALRWQGVAMVEFRQDEASDRLGLMEVNGRFWGSVALPIACGVDFPYYTWQLAHNEQPRPPAGYPAGIRFRWLAGDVKRFYECMVSGSGSRIAAAGHFVREFPPAAGDAIWSWRDPVPAFEELIRAAASVASMAGGALAHRFLSGATYRRIKALRRLGAARAARYVQNRFFKRPGLLVSPVRKIRFIVFICHGNIVRSPMAAALFRSGGTGIQVESAGTAAVPGREVDARAAQVAREFGVDLEGHTARRVSEELVAEGDLLVLMDYINYVTLVEMFPKAKGKVLLLAAADGSGTEIDDPFEGAEEDIRAAFRRVEKLTRALLRRLTQDVPHARE